MVLKGEFVQWAASLDDKDGNIFEGLPTETRAIKELAEMILEQQATIEALELRITELEKG